MAPRTARRRAPRRLVVAAAGAAALLGATACSGGDGKAATATTASSVDGSGTTLGGLPGGSTTTVAAAPPTTASKYITAGERHTLPGGATVAASYAKAGLAVPKGFAPPPAGKVYAFMSVKVCAAKDADLVAGVDPSRFKVEVPGQGFVAWDPATPEIRKPNLGRDQKVPAGTCTTGNVHYVIGGELHIEAILYEAPDGLYRWAS